MAIHQAGENLRQMGHGQSGASNVVLPFSRWAGWRSEPRLTHVEKTSRYFHAILQGWPVDIPNITIYPTVVLFDGQIILNHTKSQDLSIWNYHKLATFPRFLKVFACFIDFIVQLQDFGKTQYIYHINYPHFQGFPWPFHMAHMARSPDAPTVTAGTGARLGFAAGTS